MSEEESALNRPLRMIPELDRHTSNRARRWSYLSREPFDGTTAGPSEPPTGVWACT